MPRNLTQESREVKYLAFLPGNPFMPCMYKDYYRRNLPHQQPPGAIFFVTANLPGCLPKPVQAKLIADAKLIRQEYSSRPPNCPEMIVAWKKLFGYADRQMDQSNRTRFLQKPEIAQTLVHALRNGARLKHYVLHRYCVMPNHFHLLIEPLPQGVELGLSQLDAGWPPLYYQEQVRNYLQKQCPLPDLNWKPLPQIMKAIKSISALAVNETFKRTGAAWNPESFDHWVRDGEEYARIINYIDQNPVRAGLCRNPALWRWSSCDENV